MKTASLTTSLNPNHTVPPCSPYLTLYPFCKGRSHSSWHHDCFCAPFSWVAPEPLSVGTVPSASFQSRQPLCSFWPIKYSAFDKQMPWNETQREMRFEQARDCFLELVKGDPERQRKSRIPVMKSCHACEAVFLAWQVLVRAYDTMWDESLWLRIRNLEAKKLANAELIYAYKCIVHPNNVFTP